MMFCLLSLDDDLLYEIFSTLIDDQPSLWRLSLVSRRCNELIRPIIFRRLHKINPQTLEPIAMDSETIKLVCRSLESRSSLASLVHSISLRSLPYDEEARERIDELLPKLTRLHSLSVCLRGKMLPFTPALFKADAFSCLSDIHLGGSKVKAKGLLLLMLRPNLRAITVQNIHLPVNSSALEMLRQKDCPILELNLSNDRSLVGFHLQRSTLQTFLSSTKNLHRLSCRIPTVSDKHGWDYHSYDMKAQLSPQLVERALHPISSTIVDLDISSGAESWPSHDGSKLNLNRFTVLKKVIIPSRLVFCSPDPLQTENGCSREGVFKLLPRSLEYLQISFEFKSAFLSLRNPFDWKSTDTHHPDMKPANCRWCLEIAENKSASFPNLKTFKVVENFSIRGAREVVLDIPAEISSLFDSNDIDFSVHCRVSRPRNCPGRRIPRQLVWNEDLRNRLNNIPSSYS